MKKLVVIGLVVLFSGLPARADLKIGVVDTGKAFDAFYKTQQMAVRIAAKRAGYQKEIEGLQSQHENLSGEAQKLDEEIKDPSTPADVRKTKDTSLAQKVQDLEALEAEIDQVRQTDTKQIKDELQRDHEEISEEILQVINAYAAAQGYDIVLDETSDPTAPSPLYFFGSSHIDDLTKDIITKLNAGAPVPAPVASH
jgi:Skp family chaperone for outer membrane proteins